MPAQQTAEFKKAVEDSRKLKAKPSDDELLQVSLRRACLGRNKLLTSIFL
jgi:acyl-CoA-binding protein